MEYPFAAKTEADWMDLFHDIVDEVDELDHEHVIDAKRKLDSFNAETLTGRASRTIAAAILWSFVDNTEKQELCEAANVTPVGLNNIIDVIDE